MSLPNIPNITPEITLDECESINLLLSSIALEEIGLSHILNAEGEKLQYFLKKQPSSLDDLLKMNNSINKTLSTIVKSQLMLLLKLEDVVNLAERSPCFKQRDEKKCKGKFPSPCKSPCPICSCKYPHESCCQSSTCKCQKCAHDCR